MKKNIGMYYHLQKFTWKFSELSSEDVDICVLESHIKHIRRVQGKNDSK